MALSQRHYNNFMPSADGTQNPNRVIASSSQEGRSKAVEEQSLIACFINALLHYIMKFDKWSWDCLSSVLLENVKHSTCVHKL